MAAGRIIDEAEPLDVEHDYPGARLGPGAAGEALAEPLAEERSLREAGQRVEVGEEMDGVLTLEVLEREGQVGRELLQELQLALIEQAVAVGAEREDADDRPVDESGSATTAWTLACASARVASATDGSAMSRTTTGLPSRAARAETVSAAGSPTSAAPCRP